MSQDKKATVTPIGVKFKAQGEKPDIVDGVEIPTTPELGTEDAVWDALLNDQLGGIDNAYFEAALNAIPD